MISRIAMIVWFGVYALNYVVAIPYAALILAIAAGVICVAMIINTQKK